MPSTKPDLAPDVLGELSDPAFAHRKHGVRSTYADGCHGPLCLWKEVVSARERYERRAERLGNEVRINRRRTVIDAREAEFTAVINWHNTLVDERKEAERAKRDLIHGIKRQPTLDKIDQLLKIEAV